MYFHMLKNVNKNTALKIAIYTFCITGIVGENVFDNNFCFHQSLVSSVVLV